MFILLISPNAQNAGHVLMSVPQRYQLLLKSPALLLTGWTTSQVVYTAENSGVNVICFVRGKRPRRETVDLAKEKKIVLLATKNPMFESCGKLYKNGLTGCSEICKQ